ncbi:MULTISPECIES: hypothetical protein [unclassified Pseudomonas]|uniref:hypothetical protein n=1 Tax=unclassified Pseudomonas TaxID=196821 RepID=UPI000CD007C2|nr:MULTISPECIES: hypothetical protein [unclassified Pseudomonas]POA34463.1 hypothetical protein C1887_04450 [Pseudomonas sp. GW456-R21]POA70533.1 hypothetical protein C1884_04025 [Pseudomonas sp. GW460-R15]
MSEPVIQANASLVVNGDFREGYSPWEKGPINPLWANRVTVSYQGEDVYCLTVGNEASVSQIIEVPKDLRADASYVINFLCESWHDKAGRLEISIEGSSEPAQVITLPPGNNQANKAHRADGQLLAFEPVEYEVELTLPLKQNDKVRVSVFSPKNQDGEYSKIIFITRINVHLHLGELKLQEVTFDCMPQSPDRLLYLCLGATGDSPHSLGFVPVENNPWLDTHASLISDDNPQGAVVTTPALGVDHPLDKLWSLDCPVIEDADAPYEFWFNLLSKYTAEAYPIKASLGHHRLKFDGVQDADYYPVFEYEQSVQLGVRVVSYYTGDPLAGRAVTWILDGQKPGGTVLTEDNGWAYYDYEPTGAGQYVIKASVESLYYASAVITQSFDVQVLATDPWKEVMAVVDGKETLWAEKTGYPNRGTEYPVSLKLPDDSPLLGTQLWLMWEGDSPAELGVAVSPGLKEPVPVTVDELIWWLTCDDRLDGKFELLLGCSKLLLPSRKKPMSLARNVVEIGEVRTFNTSPVVDEEGRVLLMVQVLHVLASGLGDPVINALVEWLGPNGTVSTVTGAGGWASVLDTPESADPYSITVQVRAHADMPPIERQFEVTPQATSSWRGKAEFDLDGVPVDLATVGIACLRGESPTFRMTPTAGSPLKDKPMTLTWRAADPGLGLTIGAPTATPEGGWEWRLSSVFGSSRSGLFELSLKSDALPETRGLSGRLLSSELADEASARLDQVSAKEDGTFFPCLGAVHRYNFLPNALSPLIGLDVMLTWSGTPADELDASVEPPLGLHQVISAGGAPRVLNFTASQENGEFSLALQLPQLKLTSTANVMFLGHNNLRIEKWHEAAVDPVAEQDNAWMWARVISVYTRQPVEHVPVLWTADNSPLAVDTDEKGWSGYPFKPKVAQRYDVEARVHSFFNGYEDHVPMTVKALASDPWKEVRVRFDRQPHQPWGAKTYFPRRKGEHRIELEVDADSVLRDQEVTLGLTGTGPTALGLSFSPVALGVPKRFIDGKLSYTLKCDDLTDGSFALRLAASRLQNLSPANAMSLGTDSQVLKIIVNNRVHQTLDWEQELVEQITVVSAISGKAMVDWAVTWRSHDLAEVVTRTDFYGVARIRFTPKTTGAGQLTATVGDKDYSETVLLPFTLSEPRKLSELIEVSNVDKGTGQESEARAQATVVSSRTGEPLEGVEVMWDFSGQALPSSVTDKDGIATLSFALTAGGNGVLMATVRGGVGGWDTAQLLYGGLVPVIESLISSELSIQLGQETDAVVTVVSRGDGQPVEGIRVWWAFPGLTLPPTATEEDGTSRITFKPTEAGEHPLTATVGFGASKSLVFTVVKLYEITEIKVSSSLVLLGSDLTADAHVEGVPQGTEVLWKFTGMPDSTSSTDAEGWATRTFTATQIPDGNFANVSATVHVGTDVESTLSNDVWVNKNSENPALGSTELWVNTTLVIFPLVASGKVSQNKDITIRLKLLDGSRLRGQKLAIYCTRNDVQFEPRVGDLRAIETELSWVMNVGALPESSFRIAISSPVFDGSTGIRFTVTASAADSDEVSIEYDEPTQGNP